MRTLTLSIGIALTFAVPAVAQEQFHPLRPVATYSIVARDSASSRGIGNHL